MEEVLEAIKEIEDKFLKMNVEVPHSAIKDQIELFYIDYKVPIIDAKSSVINHFLKEYDVNKGKFFGITEETTITKIEDLHDGEWVNLKVKVVQLWEKTHESISQVGLIGDETGIVKFTKWSGADIQNMEIGKVYKFNNVVVNEWKEKFQISLNKNSQIFEIDEYLTLFDVNYSGATNYLKESDIDKSKFFENTKEVTITKIEDLHDGEWVNLKVKVIQLWEKTHESISQVGLIGDETGIVKFTKWSGADIQNMEIGKVYKFNNVVVNEWKEKFQIGLNKNSQIFEIDEDIIVQKNTTTFKGALLHIQSGSGLIKRCSECNRALDKGICSIHGKTIGEYDLRIKAVFDNGIKTVDCIINRE
ncbi:MAG: replication protein A, partial [Methanosarcinales archaeon]|nr:replication protein A [Methanosarcinales archaeon]